MSKNLNLYIYLARRDKTGIRIIAPLMGQKQIPNRLDNQGLNSLQLPQAWNQKISQIIYDNRMLWEPWIESIDNFLSFRENLKKRGYTNIPISNQPEFTEAAVQTHTVNVAFLPKRKTMIRKS